MRSSLHTEPFLTRQRFAGSSAQKGAPTGTSSSDSSSSSGSSLSDLAQECLDAHNSFRKTHHANPLSWNTTLETAAQKWADHCVWEHSGGKVGPYGENLFAVSPVTQTQPLNATSGIGSW